MKNKALKKLIKMSEDRQGAPRLVVGVNTPLEVKEALLKGGRGEVKRGTGVGIHVLMEKPQRDALNRLAAELDLNAAETIRLMLRAATVLGKKGLVVFVDAANRMETANLRSKFKQSAINKSPEKENDEEGPELDEDAGGERGSEFETPKTGTPIPERKRKKGQGTGAPRPNEERTL